MSINFHPVKLKFMNEVFLALDDKSPKKTITIHKAVSPGMTCSFLNELPVEELKRKAEYLNHFRRPTK